MPEKLSFEEAKDRVEELRGFYSHLAAYVLVNCFLFFVNLQTSPNHLWFYWPLMGWGIGLALHAVGVFFEGGIWSKQWEKKKISELMGDDEGAGKE